MNNPDRLRAKFALALGRKKAETTCPPLENIVAWHENALSASDAQATQSHVANCRHCFALWDGLVELEPADAPATVTPARKVRWWHFAAPAMALGVVAMTLWVGILGSDPLPAYALDVQGGLDVRGGSDASLILEDQTLLRILITPASAVDEPIEAAAYALTPDGLSALGVNLVVTAQGVASLEAVIGQDVAVADDTQRLLIVVGRRGQLPSGDSVLEALSDQTRITRDDWQAFSVHVKPQPET
ncbi:MAG: hypothetical protein AB8G17_10655 [Gammaproteobacteria bacterium]